MERCDLCSLTDDSGFNSVSGLKICHSCTHVDPVGALKWLSRESGPDQG